MARTKKNQEFPDSRRDTFTVKCTKCGHSGGDYTEFNVGLLDDCLCPNCGKQFPIEDDNQDYG